MNNKFVARTVNDYVETLKKIACPYCNVMYRGQVNESWEIKSSALRLLEVQCRDQNRNLEEDPIKISELKQYHKVLLNGAKRIHEISIVQKDDISLLAHLQHKKSLVIDTRTKIIV